MIDNDKGDIVITELLRIYTSRPIISNRGVVVPLAKFSPSTDSSDFTKFAKEIFKSPQANPTDSKKIAECEALFRDQFERTISPVKGKESFASAGVDALAAIAKGRKISKFETRILELVKNNKYVALVGKRGTGKTHLLNRLLNSHSAKQDVFEYLWFRIDAAKVAKIIDIAILRAIPQQIRLDMFRIFCMLQVVFVVFRYGFLPSRAQSPKGDARLLSFFSSIDPTDDLADWNLLKNYLDTNYQSWQNHPDPSLYILSDLMVTKGTSQNETKNLMVRLFQSYFVKIAAHHNLLLIVEGADNVAWDTTNESYMATCKALNNFFEYVDVSSDYRSCKFLLVARPELVSVLDKFDTRFSNAPDQGFLFQQIQFNHSEPSLAAARKILVAQRNTALLAGARTKYNPNGEDIAELRQHVKQFSRLFKMQYLEALKLVPNSVMAAWRFECESRNLFADLFDYNYRAYWGALLNTWQAMRTEKSINVIGAGPNRLLEYVVKDGNLYKKSVAFAGHRGAKKSQLIPNIFWYNYQDVRNTTTWKGLCGYKILSLLSRHSEQTPVEIKELLSLFGYEEKIIEEQLKTFLACGLIEFVPLIDGMLPNRFNVSRLNITEKGKVVCILSLYFQDWLNFLILDTPVFRELVEEVRIEVPRETNKIPLNYNLSKVINIATFIRQVVSTQKNERALFDSGFYQSKNLQGKYGSAEILLDDLCIGDELLEFHLVQFGESVFGELPVEVLKQRLEMFNRR